MSLLAVLVPSASSLWFLALPPQARATATRVGGPGLPLCFRLAHRLFELTAGPNSKSQLKDQDSKILGATVPQWRGYFAGALAGAEIHHL